MTTAPTWESLSLTDILAQYPQTEAVLTRFGLIGYAKTPTAQHENLRASALVNAVDYAALLGALEQAIHG